MSRLRSPFDAEAEAFLRAFLHAARNAMQRGQTALSLLRLEAAERTELLDLIDEAESGSEELAALLETARLYVRPVDVETREVDVTSLIDAAWCKVVPEGADAILCLERTPSTWRVDAALLCTAFEEILRNSLETGEPALRVRARCQERRSDGQRTLEVCIADNGPGLETLQRERALEPFWSTRAGARGMGLPIARKAVEAHGGQLWLRDVDDRGVEVVVCLPTTSC